jgi:hypothetical protein
MALTTASTCQFEIEPNRRCGSPALRRMRYCYFHQRAHKRNARKLAERARQRWFESVNTNDPKAVQRALAEVVWHLASGSIDPDKVGVMLHELQEASDRLRAAAPGHRGRI